MKLKKIKYMNILRCTRIYKCTKLTKMHKCKGIIHSWKTFNVYYSISSVDQLGFTKLIFLSFVNIISLTYKHHCVVFLALI